MDVELRQLRAFVAVAEERSFTAAARRLHLTQQSVSALVGRLETGLGTALFERTTRRVEITPAGDALLDDVRRALAGLDAALGRAAAAAVGDPPLRLAFSPAVSFGELDALLGSVAAAVPAADPGVAPTVRELWADEIPDALRAGRFDAALGVALRPEPGIDLHPWRRHRVDLLVADEHPLARHLSVPVATLDGVTFAFTDRSASAGVYDALMTTFAAAGVAPVVVTVPRVSGAVPAPVASGTAVTVWLTGMDDRYVPAGCRRIALVDPETVVTTSLAVPSSPNDPNPALTALRDAVDRTRT